MNKHSIQDVFIGIDGGASRTRGVIFDSAGNTLLSLESEGSNLALYSQEAAERISHLIEDLINKTNTDRDLVRCIGLGIAGSSDEDGRDILFKELDKIEFSEKTLLTNDAEAAYQVCCPSDQGILVTVGTGVICIGKNCDGKLFRTAGKGHYQGDIGSGFWLGSQLIVKLSTNDDICAYNPLDAKKISEVMYSKLEISNLDQDLEKIAQSSSMVKSVASLAEEIILLAENNNEVALSLVQEATTAIADYIIELTDELGYKSKDIALSINGSVIYNKFFRKSLEDALQFNFKSIKWIVSKIPAAYGAAILAAKFKGINIKPSTIADKGIAIASNS